MTGGGGPSLVGEERCGSEKAGKWGKETEKDRQRCRPKDEKFPTRKTNSWCWANTHFLHLSTSGILPQWLTLFSNALCFSLSDQPFLYSVGRKDGKKEGIKEKNKVILMLLSIAVCPERTTWALNITQVKSFTSKQGRLAGRDFFHLLLRKKNRLNRGAEFVFIIQKRRVRNLKIGGDEHRRPGDLGDFQFWEQSRECFHIHCNN